MLHPKRPDPVVLGLKMPRPCPRSRIALAWFAVAAMAATPVPARSQTSMMVQGFLDAEAWETDARSRLLSRNTGDAAVLGRLRLLGAGQLGAKTQFLILGEFQAGNAQPSGEPTAEGELEQILVRHSRGSSIPLVLEAGVLPSPVGAFGPRRFSHINPLIGAPDAYDTQYPRGVQVSGRRSRIDGRMALVDLPVVNTKYLPEPGRRFRLAMGAGFTPATGIRIGASFTQGPYLNPDLNTMLPAGSQWSDYDERIFGVDVQFSRGYLEVNGELIISQYNVPNYADDTQGVAHYTEVKYTWSPRLFSAIRLEQNNYAFIRPVSSTFWVARTVNFYDAETGVGYRLGPRTLLKVAYRRDLWTVEESLKSILPDGYSVSAQVSQSFDVASWSPRPR